MQCVVNQGVKPAKWQKIILTWDKLWLTFFSSLSAKRIFWANNLLHTSHFQNLGSQFKNQLIKKPVKGNLLASLLISSTSFLRLKDKRTFLKNNQNSSPTKKKSRENILMVTLKFWHLNCGIVGKNKLFLSLPKWKSIFFVLKKMVALFESSLPLEQNQFKHLSNLTLESVILVGVSFHFSLFCRDLFSYL